MKKLSPYERIWAMGLLITALSLGIKSFCLDSWQPRSAEELAWSEAVSQTLEDEPDSWLQDKGLLAERVVAVRKTPGNEALGTLKITVRSYIGGYLPIGDRKLTGYLRP